MEFYFIWPNAWLKNVKLFDLNQIGLRTQTSRLQLLSLRPSDKQQASHRVWRRCNRGRQCLMRVAKGFLQTSNVQETTVSRERHIRSYGHLLLDRRVRVLSGPINVSR
jgi:hypothetical protein